MKKVSFVSICILLLASFQCDGPETDDSHYRIPIKNIADYTIYVDLSLSYPDTTIGPYDRDVSLTADENAVSPQGINNEALRAYDCFEEVFDRRVYRRTADTIGIDTLIIFVYHADTLLLKGWEYVKRNQSILQRYDLGLDDLRNLGWYLTFPPSDKMKSIKMWPPYGTYDSSGQRIR